jgi:hypothetical protein
MCYTGTNLTSASGFITVTQVWTDKCYLHSTCYLGTNLLSAACTIPVRLVRNLTNASCTTRVTQAWIWRKLYMYTTPVTQEWIWLMLPVPCALQRYESDECYPVLCLISTYEFDDCYLCRKCHISTNMMISSYTSRILRSAICTIPVPQVRIWRVLPVRREGCEL